MDNNSRSAVRGSIFLLAYRIWRSMPVLLPVWLGIPLLLGVLIVPVFSAQRALVDLFMGGRAGREWAELLLLAWSPLAVITGISLLRAALSALHNVVDARFRDRATMQIQSEVHQKAVSVPLERMEQAEYYDRLQRAKGVAGTDLFGVLHNVIALLRLLFEFIGLFIVAWLAHPIIGALLMVVFSLSFAVRLESDIVVRRLNRDLTQSGRQSDYLREALTKPETVKEMRIFGSLDYLIGKWSGIMRDSLALRMDARRREIKRGIFVSSVQIIGLIGAVAWMVLQMKSGEFTAGTFIIVFLAMRQAYSISGRMAHPTSKIYIQSTKVYDLAEFLNENQESLKAESISTVDQTDKELILRANQAPKENGQIIFDNVNYRYANAVKPALSNICLTLNPGETVALVGENGAGKSTLVRLLLGLYCPTAGRITWDGADYKQLNPVLLRRSISAVFQDFVRYETTLRDNVGFGLPDHIRNDAAIHGAMKASGTAYLEGLTGGLDAKIGLLSAGGRELSGGQWQRLAIARAALRDTQLLVLDEPTAALDPQHETELYHSFREMAKGKTVLFVSHRLGWARFANRIVVLKNGEIVEEGSHEMLLAADGAYAAMFRAQAQWYRGA
ncbi:ABC transporter ATP-binding protein/permease [Paenibacillus sp. sptzw28]|uniref:ABC transporter ATP-binding protein n=1 Tax=Paenibacillus sp. sptzw28 TaxID=715179 RepID=UPI001C6DF19D|nr:ABC transporter ATP-binding protein [Paenibacillus sp. sptzw28]QYR22549.1 ABC transporter ATP-binding protein/permease [Paenibacillus sp. sptzw28]